jgi:hypothetical protein
VILDGERGNLNYQAKSAFVSSIRWAAAKQGSTTSFEVEAGAQPATYQSSLHRAATSFFTSIVEVEGSQPQQAVEVEAHPVTTTYQSLLHAANSVPHRLRMKGRYTTLICLVWCLASQPWVEATVG